MIGFWGAAFPAIDYAPYDSLAARTFDDRVVGDHQDGYQD